MINPLRITLSNNVPYENPTIYSKSNGDQWPDPIPDLFEDAQVVIVSKDGHLVLPDYQIVLVHLSKARPKHSDLAFQVKRIRLSDDQVYENCQILPKEEWARFGIPMIFRDFEQLVFTCRDGTFVTSDYNVMDIRYR